MRFHSLILAMVFGACAALPLLAIPTAIAQAPAPKRAGEIPVHVDNFSTPELCAEKDNIFLPLSAPAIKSFAIEAVHPAYIGALKSDHWTPDWTSCDMTHDPRFGANARRITFWETPEFWLVGYSFPSFWRPARVPVSVGARTEEGLHLVQLWMRYRERAEEILVFYPPDGYWRFRPLPFADMRWTAYGSSVLIGPVSVEERPVVDIKSVAFDPKTLTFRLDFVHGGAADIHISAVDQDHISIAVSYEGALPAGAPFAALRSMYSNLELSDTAQVAWRGVDSKGASQNFWSEAGVMEFKGANVQELWARRPVMSRHNTSAPDIGFRDFSAMPVEIKPTVLPKEE